jgi:dihydroflavonol-4-reductase
MTDSNKTAFVTGGTGFLGRHIIDALLDDGWAVTALYRPDTSTNHLADRGIALIPGDVTDIAAITAAMPSNVSAVFHVAGNTSQWSRNKALQDSVNIGGTQHMLEVAREKQARRFVHTSSISAYGCQRGTIYEDTPSIAPQSSRNYERSKHAAEQLVRRAAADGMDAVILNPSAIIGPADTNNWARSFFIARDGSIPGAPSGATSMCDVRDVAQAHIAAYYHGKNGENFLLGGPAVSYRDMLVEIGRLVGKDMNLRAVPAILMTMLGQWNQLVSMITGKEPDITPEIAYMMSQTMECSSAKAIQQLGYADRDWRASIKDSFNWLVDEGLY